MGRLFWLLAWIVVALAAHGSARAQETSAPAEAVHAPAALECFPACRRGFLCKNASCIFACNPPCAVGEQCRDGECYASAPPMAAPPPTSSDQAAASESEAQGKSRHDGFMLRLALGAGYSNTPVEIEGRDSDEDAIRGYSFSWSFDIGGAVAENLALHARVAEFAAVDPTVSVKGNGLDADSLLSGIMLGPALTYYFMPANLYFTLALGMSWLTADDDQSDNDSTGVGFGANLDLGKEWWVSDNWGLGLAARFWWTHTTETEAAFDVTYNMLGIAALFCATYN